MTEDSEEEISDALKRWKLVLGEDPVSSEPIPLNKEEEKLDEIMSFLYTEESDQKTGSGRKPTVSKWLGEIKELFPPNIVHILQRDVLAKIDLNKILKESDLIEMLEPDVETAGIILSLKNNLDENAKRAAEIYINKLVEKLIKKLKFPIEKSIRGAKNKTKSTNRPLQKDIDWHKTIKANLRNYQPNLETVILEKFKGWENKSRILQEIFLVVDLSGSMAGSAIYSGICAHILSKIPSIQTRIIVFDTDVLDLTNLIDEPVKLLLGMNLGGGTDIRKAIKFTKLKINNPSNSILILISDLEEGGSIPGLLEEIKLLKHSGVHIISITGLDESGNHYFSKNVAQSFSKLGITPFACSPEAIPEIFSLAINNVSNFSQLVFNVKGTIANVKNK
jgi:hypothetical protein